MEERFPFLKLNDNANDFGSAKNNEATQKTKTIKKPAELLKEGTRVLVVGAPGAGKSVLVKYLALQILSLDEYHDRLPIFIELKSISQDKFKKLEENFENLLVENIVNKALGLDENRDLIHNRLKESLKIGKVNIFLDGLDEIKAEPFFNKLCESISSFLKVINPSNNLIISSRPYAVETVFHSIKEMEIAPLNSNQIKQFIHCYYPEESTALIEQLEKREQKELTRVPLLLSILISLYRKKQVVDNRLDLYKLIINYLVTVIDKEKNVARNFNIIDPEGVLKLKLLKELAFKKIFDENVQNTQNFAGIFTFTDNQILEIAKTFYQNDLEKAVLLTKNIKSLGIIREIASQTYAFTHPTIHEYLAATVLSEQNNSEDLICQIYFNEVLVQLEVLPMAIGLSKKSANIYRQLRDLPESLGYTNLKLRIRGLIYFNGQSILLENELKCLCKQFVRLIKRHSTFQSFYEEHIFSLLSRINPLYQKFFVTPLITLSNENAVSIHARISAITALERINDERIIDELINKLSDTDWVVRDTVTETLGNIITEKSVYKIINLLEHQNHDIQISAIEILSYVKNETIIAPLLKLLNHENELIRNYVANTLGYIPCKQSIEALFKLLEDSERQVCNSAINSLEKIRDESVINRLIGLINDGKPIIRSNAIRALRRVDSEPVITVLLNLLKNDIDEVRKAVIEILPTIKDERIEDTLISLLDDSRDFIRIETIRTLGMIKSKNSIDKLLNLLDDKNIHIVQQTITSLSQIEDKKAVIPLINLLNLSFETKPDNFTFITSNIFNTLIVLKSNDLEKILLKFINYQDKDIHHQASMLLTQIEKLQNQHILENLLTDQDPAIRIRAAIHLFHKNYNNKNAEQMILEYLSCGYTNHLNRDIQHRLVYMLTTLQNKEAISLLATLAIKQNIDLSLRVYIIRHLRTIPNLKSIYRVLIEKLFICLSDKNWDVCSTAINTLVIIKHRIGNEFFNIALKNASGASNKLIRKTAIDIMGYYSNEKNLLDILQNMVEEETSSTMIKSLKLALSKYKNKIKLSLSQSNSKTIV